MESLLRALITNKASDLHLRAGDAELVEVAGGKKWVEAEADSALSSAMRCLTEADMPEDVRAEFAAIAEFVTARQW